MTISVHRILDILKKHPNAEMELEIVPDETVEKTKNHLEAVIEAFEVAECFDFGTLPLEESKEYPGKYEFTQLTDDEYEAFRLGMIPLPAPVVWYEFTLGNTRQGILVVEGEKGTKQEDMWSAQRHYLKKGDTFTVDGIYCSCKQSELEPVLSGSSKRSIALNIHGNTLARKLITKQEREQRFAVSIPLAIYLTLMIGSKTTEVIKEPAPAKLNKARIAKGNSPLPDHRVVRIVPERYLRERRAESGLTRLPPRMHWRRSHLRFVDHKTRQAKQLADGRWAILIPRILVSKASEAEVSHEYRIG